MDDLIQLLEPSYGEMLKHIEDIKKEVKNLDEDSLINEVMAIQHYIIGKEADKIQYLIFKNNSNELLDDDELDFLKNVYLIYHCGCAIIVDEPEEDEI